MVGLHLIADQWQNQISECGVRTTSWINICMFILLWVSSINVASFVPSESIIVPSIHFHEQTYGFQEETNDYSCGKSKGCPRQQTMDIQPNKNWRNPKLPGQDNDWSFKKVEPHRFFPAVIFYQDKNISVLTPLGNWRIFSQFAYLVSCS